MNATGTGAEERSVQLAVMRTPTASLSEAAAEARRNHDPQQLPAAATFRGQLASAA